MSLRRQLLLVSLLLLALPWAGCEFLRETENAMRLGQQDSLQTTAQAIAALLASRADTLYPYPQRRTTHNDDTRSIYAHPADQAVIIDGYDDGWEGVRSITFHSDTSNVRLAVRSRIRGNQLYLLLRVFDDQIRYFNPGSADGLKADRLLLRTGDGANLREYSILAVAPGSVRARPANRRARSDDAARIQGFWQDAVQGYSVELSLPLALTGGRLGVVAVDEDHAAGKTHYAGNFAPLSKTPAPWLITPSPQVDALLAAFSGRNYRLQVVDAHGWLLFDAPARRDAAHRSGDTFWLLKLLYRNILLPNDLALAPGPTRPGKTGGAELHAALAGTAASGRYTDPDAQSRTLQATATPIVAGADVLGAVLLRQSGETYLSLTDRAFSRLLNYSLLALAVSVLGLLGYASLLSYRIRKLSGAAGKAIGEDGTVAADFAPSRAADEIGELSRHYGDLLERVRNYQDYLRSLSRKLSHELRTPIAVIQSSLDNLEHADEPGAASEYRERAREGLARLQHILTAMSEASGLEDSIRSEAPEAVDLLPLLRQVWQAYRDIYSERQLELTTRLDSVEVLAVPELIVQALDKLVDNAVSFTPPGGRITLRISDSPDAYLLQLDNDGPALPADGGSLFDPMVSVRDAGAGGVHLGLGLHIVRLIADYHQGEVSAHDRADGRGVVITLKLPREQ